MATVVKDFKVKAGLIVEGSTATVNNFDVLTKSSADETYITNLVGGSGESANVADTLVLRDSNGDFAAGTITADLSGDVTGDVTGTVSDISNHSTTDLSEGTNLYYTDARVDTYVSTSMDTDDLGEGVTNLYFTDQRALDATSAAYDASGSASTAESNANSYTDSLIGDVTVDGTAGNTVTDRIATAVSDLVDSAPATLDTLNELAAALNDNPDVITNLTTEVGTKVSKAGDTMTGALVLSGDPTLALHAATKQYVDQAETDANTYTDGEITTVNTTIGNLTTDDIAEGTNQYYTDEKAQDAVGAMLGGTQTNITVTYDDNAGTLSFVAENGVADSTTDDLTEGSTNLYFTDARAVDALEAVVPNFTEVDINSVATQVAATQTVATASQVVGYSFDSTTHRSAKFLVKVVNGTHSEVSEVLVTLDSSNNIAITEYAVVGTNGSMSTITAGMSGNDVQLLVTTANNSSDVTVMGTLLV